MATSSITTNIVIQGEKACIDFLNALEESKNVIPKKVTFQKPVITLHGDEIKEFFKVKTEDE